MTIPSDMEIAISSIKVFADDGTMDMEELNFLMGLALRDNVIDEDEKRVLGSIFDKCPKGSVSIKVYERIRVIREKHNI